MSRGLKEHLSSSYFEAANRMTPKKARRRIVAYVESYDDIFFWRTVLGSFENTNLYFEVMLPSKENKLERGKKAALMSLIGEKVGNDMIACVDADYDYLLQGATLLSKTILNNPFVFHTYAYAIENLQCFAGGLHEVCVAATLNDHFVFDFTDFFSRYSRIVFPLFVWNIWHYRTGCYSEFTLTDFNRMIDLGRFSIHRTDELLEKLRNRIDHKLRQLRQRHTNAKTSWNEVKADLLRLGVTPDTTYLYIQGHHLADTLVIPMLMRVCELLIHEREIEIRQQSVHATQMRNELASYAHSVADMGPMLKKSKIYVDAAPFLKIKKDIQAFLNRDANINTKPINGTPDNTGSAK